MSKTIKDPEFLNKAEIKGIVSDSVINRVGGNRVCRFTIKSEYAFQDRSGYMVVECLKANVTAWEGKDICPLESIQKNANIHVKGRIRTYTFTMADGTVVNGWEIIAKEIKIING